MRFGRGANVHFHLACASVRKHLLLEARQRCREFFVADTHCDPKAFVVRANEMLTPFQELEATMRAASVSRLSTVLAWLGPVATTIPCVDQDESP